MKKVLGVEKWGRSLRVLVVEDSQDTRDGLCPMLEGRPVRLTPPVTVQTGCGLLHMVATMRKSSICTSHKKTGSKWDGP